MAIFQDSVFSIFYLTIRYLIDERKFTYNKCLKFILVITPFCTI